MVPQTVWFFGMSVPYHLFFSSWSEKWPMSFKKSSGECSNISRIRETNFFVFCFFPNRCRCTSTWIWVDLRTSHTECYSPPSFWGFLEQLQCCESTSKQSTSHYSGDFMNHAIFLFPRRALIEDIHYFCQDQSTEADKTYPFTVDNLTALSFNKLVLIHGIAFRSIVDPPYVSWLLIQDQILWKT